MFTGRILVVSDRDAIVSELAPLIRAEGHLCLAVPTPEEALTVLEEGIIPDVVIGDSRSEPSPQGARYLNRFRQLNQFGQYLTVMEQGTADAEEAAGRLDDFSILPHPFDARRVRGCIEQAMEQIRRDLQALRGEFFRETARLQKAIRDAQLDMVTALALTMEAKDPYMHGHCARVAEMCGSVARELGVDGDLADTLDKAALLHEIGKMGVSLELLHKTTPLTPTELREIRAHPQVGAQIVGAVPSLRRLVPVIENQYTDFCDLPPRIDPDAPEFLLAGILRVADTFDAMTSNRSYRETLPRERWMPTLRDGAGRRFHPDAVAALFRLEARLNAR